MILIKNFLKNIFVITNKYFVMIYACNAIIITYLNWHARAMKGLYENYPIFKKIILSEFTYKPLITFPMWGYGWLLCITENKIAILCIQQILAFASLWFLIQHLKQSSMLSKNMLDLFKIFLLASVPWYAFHAVLWPNSIAISLTIFSLVLLSCFLNTTSWQYLITSGILFGTILNFRSDYILLPVSLSIICFTVKSNFTVKQIILWFFCIYMMLIPWAFYTKKACDHYLLTSTNSGLVCFIGLGNDPNNPWGVIANDGDPLALRIIQEHGQSTTLNYQSNLLLTKEWLNRIFNHPISYLKKCFYTLKSIITEGSYQGGFFDKKNFPTQKQIKKAFFNSPFHFFISKSEYTTRLLLQEWSYRYSKYLIMISTLLLFFSWWYAYNTKNFFMLIIIGWCWYQITLSSICLFLPSYTTNILIPLTLNLCYGLLHVKKSLLSLKIFNKK